MAYVSKTDIERDQSLIAKLRNSILRAIAIVEHRRVPSLTTLDSGLSRKPPWAVTFDSGEDAPALSAAFLARRRSRRPSR